MEVVKKRICEVDLLGHCTFCQGKLANGRLSLSTLEEGGGGDDEIRRDEELSFHHIWAYLFQHGGDQSAGVKYVFKDVDVSLSVPVYQDVPPMCPCCEERLLELDRLHKELMKKVENVRKIVIAACGQYYEKSKKMGAGLGEKLQNSALKESVKVSTLQFLNELVKACNKFQSIDHHEVPNEDDEELEKEKNLPPSWKQSGSPSPNFLELPKDSLEGELLEVKEEPDSSDSQSISGSNYEDEVEDHRDNEITDFVNETSASDGESEGSSSDEVDAAAVSPNVGDGEFTNESDMSNVEFEASNESMEKGKDNEAASSPSSQEESSVDSDSDSDAAEEESSKLPNKRKKQPNIKKAKTQPKSHSHPVLEQRCDLCKQRIPFKEIRQHLEAQHNVQDYISKCPNPNCKYIYSNRRSLETLHLFSGSGKKCREFTDIPPEKKFDWFRKCERCDFRHETIRAFKSHLLFHENHEDLSKNFPCPIPECEERYALRQSLELHLREHAPKLSKMSEKTDQQPCPVCPDKPKLQVGEEMTAHLKEAHAVQEVLSCRQCPFVFPNREGLLKHLSRHKSEGILCDICDDGVKYPSHIRVLRHYITKHQIGHEFECEVCSKSFLYLTSLKSHQQVVHPELYPAPDNILKLKSPMGCDICNKSCTTEKGLILHKIKAHGADNEPLKCQTCGRVSSDFISLAIHMESHADVQFKCREQNCDKICSTRRMLQKHIRSVHVVGKKACETCGKRFTSSTTLRRHIQNIHQGRKHLCSICGIQYRTTYSLEVHMRTHTGLKPYQCPKCGLKFHDRIRFNYHTKQKKSKCDPITGTGVPGNSQVVQGVHDCEFCCNTYVTRKALRCHIRLVHERGTTKVCETCGKEFYSNATFQRHIKTVHSGRKHCCTVCEAELSSAKSLKAHLKLHAEGKHERTSPRDGEIGGGMRTKTFKCNIEGCQENFPTKKELFDHKKAVHGGWERFVCESCGKSFTTEKYLRLHNKRYHLGLLETFHCDICGKSSSSRTTLKNHRMTHTGERPLSCHLCGQPFRTDSALRKHLRRHEQQGDKFQPRGAFKSYKGRPC